MDLKPKLIALFALISIVPIFFIGYLSYENSRKAITDQGFKALEAIVESRKGAVETLFVLRIQQASMLASKATLKSILLRKEELRNGKRIDEALLDRDIAHFMNKELKEWQDISGFYNFIFTDKWGMVQMASDSGYVGMALQKDPRFERGMKEPFLSDILIDHRTGDQTMQTVVSVHAADDSDHPLGVIILTRNTVVLRGILNMKNGLGETGEVLLAQLDGKRIQFINLPRNVDVAPVVELGDSIGSLLQQAVTGVDDQAITVDHQNVPIIAVWRHIPNTHWGMVAKMDTSEALASIYILRKNLIIAGVILALLAMLVAVLFANAIARPIQKITAAFDRAALGEKLEQLDIKSKDETGRLTLAFNALTKQINQLDLDMAQQVACMYEAAIVSETDRGGKIIGVNDKFCEVSGYTREELLGKNHRILKSGLQPDDLFEEMWKTISSGRTWRDEIMNKRKDGSYFWADTTIMPFKDSNGTVQKYVSVRFDITMIKEYEQQLEAKAKKLKQNMLQLAATNKELETFSYSVSHDLKAPLRTLQGFSKNLHEKYADSLDETGNRWLKYIETNAQRMDDLIVDILTFSRISRAELVKKEVDMDKLANEVFGQEKMNYTQQISFTKEALPSVWGDESMLRMVWQNLIGKLIPPQITSP